MTKSSSQVKISALSPEQRLKQGRERRNQVSRKQLGVVHSRNREFDPVELLVQCQAGRMEALLPLKYARMAVSPFAFFRGSVAIMAADLAHEPHTGVMVQLCGDAHVQNMGSFEGPDGRLVFDMNDFDETIAGPWEWDVKRMAASVVLAGYESNHGRATCARAVEAFAVSYCKAVAELAEVPVLTAARHQIRRLKKAAAVSAALAQAARATPCDLLSKYTTQGKSGSHVFRKLPNTMWRVMGDERSKVLHGLPGYRAELAPERRHWFDFFEPQDVGFKVVGTGSVGLRGYVVLMFGNGEADPLFLQIKQEVESVYAPYLKSPAGHQGQRVAEGQRRIQPLSDLLLGATRIDGHDYLVRQLNDHKGSVNLELLREDGLAALAKVAGELIARGHVRSGDALQLKGYIGGYDRVAEAIVEYAVEYAGQVQADFEQFQKAIRAERLKVAPETKKPNRSSRSGKASSAKASA